MGHLWLASRWLLLFCASLALSGCSIKTTHLQINEWPIAKRAMYYQEPSPYRVAVLPLADERPSEERDGTRPRGLFLLLWNRRIGDYVTGDRVFGQDVPGQLTGQLTTYLQSANVFAQLVPASSPQPSDRVDAAQIRRLGQQEVVDYVLGGAIEHFYGSQHQHTSAFFLPLYFVSTFGWQDSKSLPWGRSTVRFVLYNAQTGDTTWRHRLESDDTLPRETDAMSEAALESFAILAGRLATELRTLPLAPSLASAE